MGKEMKANAIYGHAQRGLEEALLPSCAIEALGQGVHFRCVRLDTLRRRGSEGQRTLEQALCLPPVCRRARLEVCERPVLEVRERCELGPRCECSRPCCGYVGYLLLDCAEDGCGIESI